MSLIFEENLNNVFITFSVIGYNEETILIFSISLLVTSAIADSQFTALEYTPIIDYPYDNWLSTSPKAIYNDGLTTGEWNKG